MSSMCDKLENWDALLPGERQDVIQDLLAHMAEDYGVPVPEVVRGVPDFPDTPEDDSQKRAAYDPDTNTLYINDAYFNSDDPDGALEEAGHEFAHELFEENFRDEDTEPGDSEAYADEYTDQMRDELQEYCDDPAPPQSPGKPDTEDGDWNLPEDMGVAFA